MKIDFFCFSIPTLNSTDYIINEEDNENSIWIKNKENELMEAAKANNMLIVFDRNTKKFYKDFQEVDITGYVIFPRSFIPYEEELLTELLKAGAFPIQTKEDCDKIINWPQFIQPIHRKIISTTYKEFQENAEIYKSMFNKLFFKTAKKSRIHCVLEFYGNVEAGNKKMFFTKPPIPGLPFKETIFLSEGFQSIADLENDINCKEYRIFVLNNELLSISRSYIDYPTIVSEKVKLFAEEQIIRTSLIPNFPNSYVLDIGEIKISDREVIDIIEYNPISSSGLEVCNNLVDELLKKKEQCKKLVKK